jgi:acetyl-CoA acetyltransferase
VNAIHTPIGRYGGALSNVRTDNLTVLIIKAVLARNLHVDTNGIDEVVFCCSRFSR